MNNKDRIGVLLTNIGSPNSPSILDVRDFLTEFLSDKRIIRLPSLIWQPILKLFILRSRPIHSAHLYSKIWDKSGSPLIVNMMSLSNKLEASLKNESHLMIKVLPAMRYGKPSLEDQLRELHDWGADRIIVFPLFPQYSTTTTESIIDALHTFADMSGIEIIEEYYRHPRYIQTMANHMKQSLNIMDPERILYSFHGIPEAYVDENPDYVEQCEETALSISKQLGMSKEKIMVTYQSRFGSIQWIKPYTDQVLIDLAQKGIKFIAVVTPGFAIECLETLEEINMAGRKLFLDNGGKTFIYIPTLNDSDAHVEMLSEILQGIIY